MSKPRFQLMVLWRTDGEQVLSFHSKREAEDHKNMLDESMGHKIIKMEVVAQQ